MEIALSIMNDLRPLFQLRVLISDVNSGVGRLNCPTYDPLEVLCPYRGYFCVKPSSNHHDISYALVADPIHIIGHCSKKIGWLFHISVIWREVKAG
jgi:hypothetical protein